MHCDNAPCISLHSVYTFSNNLALWRTILCANRRIITVSLGFQTFHSKYKFKTVSLETKQHPTVMSFKAECAWARVCIRQTKQLCSNLKKCPGEGSAKFGARVLAERYKLYTEQFKEYPQFTLSQYDFNRVCKVIDEKVSNWRHKGDKETYLSTFSVSNWSEGNNITKEMKKAHSLSNCKPCTLLNSNLQATFPDSKRGMAVNKGPLSEIQEDAKKHTAQLHTTQKGPKITNKQLKGVGQVIYSSYDEKCKENFGKSLSEILVLVPEAGLERKLSPVEKRKLKRDQQRQMKTNIESNINENDTEEHLSSRQSYKARQHHRLAQSFETIAEASERAKTTPPKVKERSHAPSTENIIGDLDQLLTDVKFWPNGTINWSEKAKLYQIRTKGQDSTPPNGGQMIKVFLQRKEVDLARFTPTTAANQNDSQGKHKGNLENSLP